MTEQEKALALSEFYKTLAENNNGWTMQGKQGVTGPNMMSDISEYIINPPKPKSKKIDLSICIKSNIDVECSDNKRIWDICKFSSMKSEGWEYCRVRQDHWHLWQGGDCPLPKGLIIEIQTRQSSAISKNVTVYDLNIWGWNWNLPQLDNDGDIIAFKVIGTAKGWEY